MILESDPVIVSAIVDEDAETVRQLASNFNVTSSSDANKKAEPLEHFPMIVRERAGGGISTYFGYLEQGRWIIDITIENRTSLDVLHRGGTTIFVQPVQDYYNAIIAIGTMIVGVGAPLVAVAGLRAQRKYASQTLAEMQAQRTATLEEMAKARQVSEDSLNVSKETMKQQLRPWIGRYDIVLDGAFMENGDYVTLKKVPRLLDGGYPVTKLVFKFWLQNYGRLPALHCFTGHVKSSTNEPMTEPDKSALEQVKLQQGLTVMPGEQIPMNIEITAEELAKNRTYVAGRVKYDYAGGEGFYDFIVEYDGLNWTPKYNEAG